MSLVGFVLHGIGCGEGGGRLGVMQYVVNTQHPLCMYTKCTSATDVFGLLRATREMRQGDQEDAKL